MKYCIWMENIQEKIFVHFYNMTVMFILRLSALLCSLMEVTDKGSFAKGRYLSINVDAIDSSGSMDGLIGCKILLRMFQCRWCKWHFDNTTYRNGFFSNKKFMNLYSCNIYFRRVLWAYYIPIWLWINFCRYCSAATGLDIL